MPDGTPGALDGHATVFRAIGSRLLEPERPTLPRGAIAPGTCRQFADVSEITLQGFAHICISI